MRCRRSAAPSPCRSRSRRARRRRQRRPARQARNNGTGEAVASHRTAVTSATGQASGIRTPRAVAAPLPPRKPSQTGNIWPRIAHPAAASASICPQRWAINTAATPFARSRSNVSAASARLPVRRTFVAPILPEPICRISPRPAKPGQQQPERDRAEEVAEYGGREGDALTLPTLRAGPLPFPPPQAGEG